MCAVPLLVLILLWDSMGTGRHLSFVGPIRKIKPISTAVGIPEASKSHQLMVGDGVGVMKCNLFQWTGS